MVSGRCCVCGMVSRRCPVSSMLWCVWHGVKTLWCVWHGVKTSSCVWYGVKTLWCVWHGVKTGKVSTPPVSYLLSHTSCLICSKHLARAHSLTFAPIQNFHAHSATCLHHIRHDMLRSLRAARCRNEKCGM